MTGLAAGNAYGERLQIFVIGKSVKPRYFKGVKTLPCRYRAQHKSWIPGELFEDWVHELDGKFAVSKRKIALIIDNCTAHPHVENLKWVELILLPPNTTSHKQPIEQGIIRALKAKYRSLAVRKLILALEKKEPIPKFSILSAMYMLKKAWDAISNQTFTNCFRKSGISEKSAEKAMNDEKNPFKGLEDDDVEEYPVQTLGADLSILKERFTDQIDAGIPLYEYANFDIEVSTSHGKLTNAEIIKEVSGTQEDNSGNEESVNVEGETIIKPGMKKCEKLLEFSDISASILSSEGQ